MNAAPELDRALFALYAISPDLPRQEWVRVGMAVQAAGLDFVHFDAWSSAGESYNARDAFSAWRSFTPGKGVGAGTLFKIAADNGWKPDKCAPLPYPARHQPAAASPVEAPPLLKTLSEAGRDLWRTGHPITAGTPAADYLRLRHCVLPPEDGHLRWLPNHKHPSGHAGPCLMALLTDAETSLWRSLHFTWIDGGGKADVQPPRLYYPRHGKSGTVCRLFPLPPEATRLGIAEGLETALSLAHGMSHVVACMDAGNLATFPVLPGVRQLVIARDRDPAGEQASAKCTARYVGAGREVLVTCQQYNDLNDLLQGLEAAK